MKNLRLLLLGGQRGRALVRYGEMPNAPLAPSQLVLVNLELQASQHRKVGDLRYPCRFSEHSRIRSVAILLESDPNLQKFSL